MATKLGENQTLKRSVRVYGIEGEVEISLSAEGIAFRIPGTRYPVFMSMANAVRSCGTSPNVRSYHMGKPYEFLQAMAQKVRARKAEAVNADND